MKNKELIEILSRYPEDMEVVVRGFTDSGYYALEITTDKLVDGPGGHRGDYEFDENGSDMIVVTG